MRRPVSFANLAEMQQPRQQPLDGRLRKSVILEMQNNVAVIKLQAERQAGALLTAMDKNKGAATRSDVPTAFTPTYSELGIDKDQASVWQPEAEVSEEDFMGVEYLASITEVRQTRTVQQLVERRPRRVRPGCGFDENSGHFG